MKYDIPTLMALRQDSNIAFHLTNKIKDCQLLCQAKKPSLSEASLNQRAKATVPKSAQSRSTRSTKNLVPKGRVNGQSSPIVKSNIQTIFPVSEVGFARFLKEHTSPKHQRVTAGGRIVPMEPAKENMYSNEYVPGQARGIHPSNLNESFENNLNRSAPANVPVANQFGIQRGRDALHIAYTEPPMPIYPGAPTPQAETPAWVHHEYHPPPRAPMMRSFNPYDGPSVRSENPLASGSLSPNAIEDWLAQTQQAGSMPYGTQPNHHPNTTIFSGMESRNNNRSQSMEDWNPISSTLTMENLGVAMPDGRGAPGINIREFTYLLGIFESAPMVIPLEVVVGLLNTILNNLRLVWYEDQWLDAKKNLESLAILSAQRLQAVNMVAALTQETSDDLVRQRCYFTNLRVLLSDALERLSAGWQHHRLGVLSVGVSRRQRAGGENATEGGDVASGLNTIEPEVMSSADDNVGGALGSVGLDNQAEGGDWVAATHPSESARPGASVHQNNNQRPTQGVASGAVPKGTKAKTTRGRRTPTFSSLLARLMGRKGAVPRSPASVAVSTATAGVVADTTTPTLSPPVGKPGESLSSGRFPID